jgi:hypothetical protein
MFEDDTGDVYRPIGVVAAKVEDAPCTGSCLRLGEIGRVAVDSENHGAGGETNFGVGVGADIVEKLVQMPESGRSGFSLRGLEAAQGYKHGAVDGLCIVQESSDEWLEVRDLSRSEPRGLVHRGCELDFSSVLRGVKEVGECCRLLGMV